MTTAVSMRCGTPSTMGDMKCRNEHTWAAQHAELLLLRLGRVANAQFSRNACY